MSRWNRTATFYSTAVTVDEWGSPVETTTPRTVFCNERRIGATEWGAARASGLAADSQIEVRAVDYKGDDSVLYCGEDYEVEKAKQTGETVLLTLRRRLRTHG